MFLCSQLGRAVLVPAAVALTPDSQSRVEAESEIVQRGMWQGRDGWVAYRGAMGWHLPVWGNARRLFSSIASCAIAEQSHRMVVASYDAQR